MANEKSLGRVVYIVCSVLALVLFLALTMLGALDVINMGAGLFGAVGVGVIWWLVSMQISKKQQAVLPIIQVQAVLIEKIQESHRGPSSYFLFFELADGSKKSFYVKRDVYATHAKNERGLLTYKQINKKEHWLNYKFIDFEVQ